MPAPTNCILEHSELGATLHGTASTYNGTTVHHYRNIPYGRITQRFREAEMVDQWKGETLHCTEFGPVCPQNYVDCGYLLRLPALPSDLENPKQDEFKCLNLNISIPEFGREKLLPVFVWIYGGSQVASFPPPAHKVSDTTSLVSQSILQGKPIIVVTINYRLNIFGFGDGSVKNLAIKDQRLALEWIQKHINGFGGDKDNITLAGESAGAVYVHAHIATSSPIKRAILQSGSLYLSTPLPVARGEGMISRIANHLQSIHNSTLQSAPADLVVRSLNELGITSMWLQEEPSLANWETCFSSKNGIEDLMLGDVEYESHVWRNGIETLNAKEIYDMFTAPTAQNADSLSLLQKIYQIHPARDTASKRAALDFIEDVRFGLPISNIAQERAAAGKCNTYVYIFDQASPFQPSSRAHHAVEITSLFGAYDDLMSANGGTVRVSREMKSKWIAFVNGEEPWERVAGTEGTERRFAFGPLGRCGLVEGEDIAERRRVAGFDVLRHIGPAALAEVFMRLHAGRVSLLN